VAALAAAAEALLTADFHVPDAPGEYGAEALRARTEFLNPTGVKARLCKTTANADSVNRIAAPVAAAPGHVPPFDPSLEVGDVDEQDGARSGPPTTVNLGAVLGSR
jgi:hypothetical protein